jgi:hypothetical protein
VSGESPREIVERHVVRSRRCGCARHFRDGFPQPCEPEYEWLGARQQLAISELRVGVVRDSEALDGLAGFVSSPPPYADADPITSPLDADDW